MRWAGEAQSSGGKAPLVKQTLLLEGGGSKERSFDDSHQKENPSTRDPVPYRKKNACILFLQKPTASGFLGTPQATPAGQVGWKRDSMALVPWGQWGCCALRVARPSTEPRPPTVWSSCSTSVWLLDGVALGGVLASGPGAETGGFLVPGSA